jgi:hypothetical protein
MLLGIYKNEFNGVMCITCEKDEKYVQNFRRKT